MDFINPMVPIEMRSSTPTPVLSNFLAIYTTRRRLCSISMDLASSSYSGRRQHFRSAYVMDIPLFCHKKIRLFLYYFKLHLSRYCHFKNHFTFLLSSVFQNARLSWPAGFGIHICTNPDAISSDIFHSQIFYFC